MNRRPFTFTDGLRNLIAATQTEAAYQATVTAGFKGERTEFVNLGLHLFGRNTASCAVMWKAVGELNAHRRALAN